MTFSVTILGSNSAAPASKRFPSSQVVNVQDYLFLVDCGEGTQMQLRKYKIKFQRINHIFISHLHGDHYLGLMGLLFTYHLLNREKELHIYAQEALLQIINIQLEAANCRLVYPLVFHKIDAAEHKIILDNEILTVETIPLKHTIPTCGFLFREKKHLRNINIDTLQNEVLEHSDFERIKRGEGFINSKGKVFKNKDITFDPPHPRSYAYCSDTSYYEPVIELIKDIDLLYYETTFKNDLSEIAAEKLHTTSVQAATIAKKADAKKLIIGHFSARYEDDELLAFIDEAATVFPNTELALEGIVFKINN